MKSTLQKNVRQNVAWFLGLFLLVGALLGGTAWRLNQRRGTVRGLQSSIDSKMATLGAMPRLDSGSAEEDSSRLESWRELQENEPRRLAEISRAARSSGITLTSVKNAQGTRIEAGAIRSAAHELIGVGNYRQVASFLDHLSAAEGVPSIERLELRPEEDRGEGILQASVEVRWFAPGRPDEVLASLGAQ